MQISHTAQNVGIIDVEAGTAPATEFAIPFGSVEAAKLLIVRNLMTSEVQVKVNGSLAPIFTIPAQGMEMFAVPSIAATFPIAAMSFLTTATPGNTESVQYWLFGE